MMVSRVYSVLYFFMLGRDIRGVGWYVVGGWGRYYVGIGRGSYLCDVSIIERFVLMRFRMRF